MKNGKHVCVTYSLYRGVNASAWWHDLQWLPMHLLPVSSLKGVILEKWKSIDIAQDETAGGRLKIPLLGGTSMLNLRSEEQGKHIRSQVKWTVVDLRDLPSDWRCYSKLQLPFSLATINMQSSRNKNGVDLTEWASLWRRAHIPNRGCELKKRSWCRESDKQPEIGAPTCPAYIWRHFGCPRGWLRLSR